MNAPRPSPNPLRAARRESRTRRLGIKILETERLILRPQTTDDAGFMLELMNEPAFIRNVADRGLRTRADALACIAEKILPSYTSFGFGFYRVDLKRTSSPIGICGLIKRESLEDVDVGFAILEKFSGCGYAYEAAFAVMEYGRKTLRLPRIIGLTAPGNGTSIHLLEKLGLKLQSRFHLPGYGKETLLFG
jgi:RimJ/RimL family protein N-acetyltransferase